MRSSARDYRIARAVWLYQRFCRVLADRHRGRSGLKARALSQRLTRWLTGADAIERAAYYQAICALDDEETTHARVSRRRGRRVMATIPPEEMARQFQRDGDDDA